MKMKVIFKIKFCVIQITFFYLKYKKIVLFKILQQIELKNDTDIFLVV